MLAVILLAWGSYTLVRMDGVDGRFRTTLSWRWSLTAEGKFLAEKLSGESRRMSNGPLSTPASIGRYRARSASIPGAPRRLLFPRPKPSNYATIRR